MLSLKIIPTVVSCDISFGFPNVTAFLRGISGKLYIDLQYPDGSIVKFTDMPSYLQKLFISSDTAFIETIESLKDTLYLIQCFSDDLER